MQGWLASDNEAGTMVSKRSEDAWLRGVPLLLLNISDLL